ncbi:MAG: HDOD domain-containing protein [Planctomycetota bacterium]|nr:HDOD domain-containing protein [Planctomycetota bacterium]
MSLDTFIARQPIFDRDRVVYGYELLHRSGWTDAFDGRDPDRATVELLNGSLLVNRFQDLTDGRLGFINVPRNLLVQDFLELLPPGQVVIEVLETVTPEPAVIAALRRLRAAGYTIALDDYVDKPGYDRLVQLADIIKVDFQLADSDERRRLIETYSREGLTFLAEKVETNEEYHEGLEVGFELFQGYFFCKPETTARKDVAGSKKSYVDFLREVNRPELELERLETIIKSDVSLSAKLLRYLNSVQFGLQDEICSIKQALIHLGERALRRWGTLMAMAGLGEDKPVELVRTCLIRARFCETLADEVQVEAGSLDLFLTGLFSAIDALMDRPLEVALEDIGLKPDIGSAIRGDDTPLSRAFGLAMACERGDWTTYWQIADDLGLEPVRVADLYAQSIFSADELFGEGAAA